MSRTASLLSALLLSGCASLAPGAVGQLARLDPMTADPATISLVAVMPVPTRLRTGDVVMQVKLDAPMPGGPIDEEFGLEVVDGAAPGVVTTGEFERVQQLRLAGTDVARLAEAQQRVRSYRASGGRRGSGELGVGIAGGCLDGPLGDGALLATVYMRTTADGEYFPLLRSVDLRRQVGNAVLAKLPSCG